MSVAEALSQVVVFGLLPSLLLTCPNIFGLSGEPPSNDMPVSFLVLTMPKTNNVGIVSKDVVKVSYIPLLTPELCHAYGSYLYGCYRYNITVKLENIKGWTN